MIMRAPGTAREVEDRAWRALSTVIDPELDEPLTALGFIASVVFDGAQLTATLRLPTAFCSPNFAFMMAADSSDALRSELGDVPTRVLLDGNADSERINASVAAGLSFTDAYPHEASENLNALRKTFQAKAHLASLERVIAKIMVSGAVTPTSLLGATLADVPASAERDALLRRRSDLRISVADDALLLVDENGDAWDTANLDVQIRFAKATRISIEGNAHFCRGLLRTRYEDGPVLRSTGGWRHTQPKDARPLQLTPTSGRASS